MPDPLFTGVNHFCVVTRDLDRAVRTWSDKYGIGPWSLYRFDRSNMAARVNGQPTDFGMRVALCTLPGGVRMEIIQPLDELSPYAASLQRHHDADHIHHVRMNVANYGAVTGTLETYGFSKPLEATFGGAPGVEGRFEGTYFSTEADLGFVVEVGQAPHGFAMAPPESIYPPPAG